MVENVFLPKTSVVMIGDYTYQYNYLLQDIQWMALYQSFILLTMELKIYMEGLPCR